MNGPELHERVGKQLQTAAMHSIEITFGQVQVKIKTWRAVACNNAQAILLLLICLCLAKALAGEGPV